MDRLNQCRMLTFIGIHEIVKSKNLIAPLIGWLVITLAAAHAAENANANATTAPGTSPSSQDSATSVAKKDEAVMLSIFQVTGQKDEGYRSTQTVSGSSTIENLRDIPN